MEPPISSFLPTTAGERMRVISNLFLDPTSWERLKNLPSHLQRREMGYAKFDTEYNVFSLLPWIGKNNPLFSTS